MFQCQLSMSMTVSEMEEEPKRRSTKTKKYERIGIHHRTLAEDGQTFSFEITDIKWRKTKSGIYFCSQ